MVLKFFTSAVLAFMIGSVPARAAVEQCRFIKAKSEREACYQRQEAALAEKRKSETHDAITDAKTVESVERMKREDDALNRRLHSICRGC
jgi:ubiquinone biosynthesis protein UbiJ